MLNRKGGLSIKQLLGVALAGAMIFSTGLRLSAQAAQGAAAAEPANGPEALVIGPGDMIHVSVFDEPDMEQRVSISSTGIGHFYLVGDMRVGGMTINQVEKALEDSLRSRNLLVNPNVNVTIEQSASAQVSVLGEVHNPGTYDISTGRNILDILSMAGGLTDIADRNITIKRKQGKDESISVFLPNDAKAAIDKSVLVYPGDTVVVPKAGLIFVLGDVNRPGGYYMQRDSTLSALQAVTMAGGLLPNAAAPHSRIVRRDPSNPKGYIDIPLQLRAMQNGKKPDIQLKADDVIYIPFSYYRNFVIQSPAILASATSALIYTHP